MLKPGDAVARFTIVSLLGTGGMGQVYRARDPHLQRSVALKILHPAQVEATQTDAAARILREARAAAALDHPNVVAIFEVGIIDATDDLAGTAYIAMELVEGRSLRDRMAERDTPREERSRWLVDIARALGAAHARGLVHRDIKPENVIVREDGVVKVLDFGIAQRTLPEHAGPMSTTEAQIISTLSTSGGVAGTPIYMAPEQMRGEAIDGRADQFAWGVVAYELLCGELPWGKGGDRLQLVANLMSKDPAPLASRDPTIAEHVSAVVQRALAKAPEARFASMSDLVTAFEGRVSTRAPSLPERASQAPLAAPPQAIATQPTKPRAVRTIATVAALGALAIGAILLARARARTSPVTPPSSSAIAVSATPSASARCAASRDCLSRERCRVLAEPGDLDDPDTVWIGALLPLEGDDAKTFGEKELHALDLARRDFAHMMVGFRRGALGRARPIALVACDDSHDPTRAVRHLVDDVGVPAVVGFRTAAEIIEIAGATLIPKDVLAIATLTTSPLLTSIPHRTGQPRLVWRTTYNATQTAAALGAAIPAHFEPELRALPGGLGKTGAMRVALVRSKATRLSAFSNALFTALSYNKKSALANGGDYRELTFDDADPARAEADCASIVSELALFAPHVVVYVDDGSLPKRVIVPLEGAWKNAQYRPRWLSVSTISADVMAFVGTDAGRRKRFFGVEEVTTSPANARLVMHYNEVFDDKVTRGAAPNSSYDAFYLLAYATYALGDDAITGASLARAFARLVPPGRPIEVGVAGIFDAFSALRRGESIDLDGATGHLDFNLATGDAPIDQAIVCIGLDDHGRAAESVESGMIYGSRTRALEGSIRCK